MANHFPVSGDSQVTGVTYSVVLANNVAMQGNTAWVLSGEAQPIFNMSFTFTFAYASSVLSVDYGSFDQDATEAMLTALLNSGRGAFGVTLADWQANISIARVWRFAASAQGSALVTAATDTMTYTAT